MKPLAKLLEGKLTEDELEIIPRSYDIIGSEKKSVAVVEIPEELYSKKKLIADAIMKISKHVRSVLNKKSGRKGVFRLEEMELVSGDDNTEVVHKEHGYVLKLDPQKVFFSPREATERQRISSKVKKSENVVVFFSGVAPYPIAIVKSQPDVNKVYAVEINPAAHEYAKENVRINKMAHKIVLINDDVRVACESLTNKFDRVVMPIAVGGDEFLDCAFKILKDGGIVHFYFTGSMDDLFSEAEDIAKRIASENKKKIKIEERVKVLPFGVRKYKICLDMQAGVG